MVNIYIAAGWVLCVHIICSKLFLPHKHHSVVINCTKKNDPDPSSAPYYHSFPFTQSVVYNFSLEWTHKHHSRARVFLSLINSFFFFFFRRPVFHSIGFNRRVLGWMWYLFNNRNKIQPKCKMGHSLPGVIRTSYERSEYNIVAFTVVLR